MDTANAASVFANFGLRQSDGAEALARGDGVAALVHAVQARASREREAAAAAAATAAAAAAANPPDPAAPGPLPGSHGPDMGDGEA